MAGPKRKPDSKSPKDKTPADAKAEAGGRGKAPSKKRKAKGKEEDERKADPLDNRALLAQIASEVAALPPPVTVPEDDDDSASVPSGAPSERAPMVDLAPEVPPLSAVADDLSEPVEEVFSRRPDDEKGGFTLAEAEEILDEEAFIGGGVPPGLNGEETEAEAKADSRRSMIVGGGAAVLVALGIGAGMWFFAGEPSLIEEMPVSPVPETMVGAKIAMPMPPPPKAQSAAEAPASGALGSEKSADRRPWLNEAAGDKGGVSAPDKADHQTPPAVKTPDAAVAAESSHTQSATSESGATAKPAEHHAVSGETPQSSPAAMPETTSHAPTPAVPSAGEGSVGKAQFAALPPLVEPETPTPPKSPTKPPRYETLPTPPGKPTPLGPAPLPELSRRTPAGVLPVIGQDGTTPWQAYARPFTPPPETKGKVAIVVMNLGLEPDATDAAILRLPPEITLAFSPYAANLPTLIQRARSAGHEVMLTLPLETEFFPTMDPGPLGLLTSVSESENLGRLETALAKAGGYVGLVGLRGARFETSAKHVGMLAKALADRGLLLVLQGASEALAQNADAAKLTANATTIIDERGFQASVDARLKYLGEAAKARGTAIGVLAPSPLGFARLHDWMASLQGSGLVVAPLSATLVPATKGK